MIVSVREKENYGEKTPNRFMPSFHMTPKYLGDKSSRLPLLNIISSRESLDPHNTDLDNDREERFFVRFSQHFFFFSHFYFFIYLFMRSSGVDSITPIKNIQARKSDISHHEVWVNERGKQAKVRKDTLNIQCSPGPRRMTSMIIQAWSSWLIESKRQAPQSPTFLRKLLGIEFHSEILT